MKDRITGVMTVQELIGMMMEKKKISQSIMANRLGCSVVNVHYFLKQPRNPYIETIERYFNYMDEEFIVLDRNKKRFNIPSTIITLSQLHKHLGTFYIKISNGSIYEIIEESEEL